MAKRQEKQYIFDPTLRTVKVPRNVDLEDLLLIINKTDNIILYTFGDAGKKATRAYTTEGTAADFGTEVLDGVTTFTLAFDTTLMAVDAELAIYIEDTEDGLKVRPWSYGTDAVSRTKVASPESQMDADFEYGLQNTKWHNLGLNNNIPSFYERPGSSLVASAITSDGSTPYSTITVTVASGAPAAGEAASVGGSTSSVADGLYLVQTSNGTTQFTYKAKGVVPAGSIFQTFTEVRPGGIYDGAVLALSSITVLGTVVTANFIAPHGFSPGSPINVYDTTAGVQDWEGTFFVTRIIDEDSIEFDTGVTIGGTPVAGNISIYAYSPAFFSHRPFDGGVEIGTYVPQYRGSAKRQTKKYFRYQSGKSMEFSTGVLFAPSLELSAATYDSGNLEITFTTNRSHGFQTGVELEATGITSANFNGSYIVKSVTGDTTFIVDEVVAPLTATGVLEVDPRVTLTKWQGAAVRSGMFDDLNGMFFEWDGQHLYAVKRSSTFQLAGTSSLTAGTSNVTGTGTRFLEQLKVHDMVQIRGQAYYVTTISSNTSMSVSPSYRGVTASNVVIAKIAERRVPQEQFNMDRIDGTGPSKYNFNPARMQMLSISWSWYGAGYIDFSMRGPRGEMVTVHRMLNNNINYEAYMRTSNLPTRYEVENTAPFATLAATTGTSGNLTLEDASTFPVPNAGYPSYIMLTSEQTGVFITEIMNYTGKTGNELTGTSRATSYTQYIAGSNRTFSAADTPQDHPAGTSVVLLSNAAPTVSHWGSAVTMDGQKDPDDSYHFTLTESQLSVASGATETVLLFRGAPSVSNNIPGSLGQREVLNRGLLELESFEIQADRQLEVIGVLNPSNATGLTWTDASNINIGTGSDVFQPSYAQYVANATFAAAPIGGEMLFRYIVPGDATMKQTFDLTQVKEITNSVLGGNNVYPNGPEVLAIVIRNRAGQAATMDFAMTWAEGQA